MNLPRQIYRFSLLLILAVQPSIDALSSEFDPPTINLHVDDLLTKQQIEGPYHRVIDEVQNLGFMNHYQIESEFGTFNADSDRQLQTRVKEIEALAVLSKLKKSEVFVESVKSMAVAPIESVQKVVRQPVETAKALPQGINRLFKRSLSKAKKAKQKADKFIEERDASDESSNNNDESSVDEAIKIGVKEGRNLARSHFGYDQAMRQLARQLRVDPYSSNPVLKAEMAEIARVMAAGSFAMDSLLPATPNALDAMADIEDLVWEADPWDLRNSNEEMLIDMGVSPASVTVFLDNKHYSVSQQTLLVRSLNGMNDTSSRTSLIEYAIKMQSDSESAMVTRLVSHYDWYHQNRMPLKGFLETDIWPIAINIDGDFVLMVAVDYLSWTSNVKRIAELLNSQLVAHSPKGKRKLYIEGRISDKARKAMQNMGWIVSARFRS